MTKLRVHNGRRGVVGGKRQSCPPVWCSCCGVAGPQDRHDEAGPPTSRGPGTMNPFEHGEGVVTGRRGGDGPGPGGTTSASPVGEALPEEQRHDGQHLQTPFIQK
jgi:hypothetical protein